MADVSLMAVAPESDAQRCAACGAELVADQRYCLACGHPVSPVRLAFLDVLSEEARSQRGMLPAGAIEVAPAVYVASEPGLGGWLRRNSGVVSLLAVLLLCLIAGLLVGHWVTQSGKSSVPATQTVKLEGLEALAPATSSGSASSTGAAAKTPSKASAATGEAKEVEEVKEVKEEKAKPKKVSSAKLKKLTSSSGKKHEEEINALGDEPIETGG